MSKCDACGSSKTCRYHGESKFYHKDDGTPVIALLGQPNSGKSTIFNLITGSHQHVGNWPEKRISFLFDPTMSKVGLQGKTIMPFFMGLGCTIAGTTGTRVVDNWGQRVLAIAMSWAVPCGATLSVVSMLAMALFGNTGGFLVIVSIFVVMIMELPPYHKPNVRNTLYVTFERTVDIFMRALRVITIVSVVFFVLTYGFGGSAETSILYQLGVIIEPVTLFFGMKWEAFLAFLASAISKKCSVC